MIFSCKLCKQEKPYGAFYENSKASHGIQTARCKECIAKANKKTPLYVHPRPPRCKTCEKLRAYTDFSQHSTCFEGVDYSRCKPCKVAKQKWENVPLVKRIYNRAKTRAKEKGWEFTLELEDIVIPERCPVFDREFVYGDKDWACSIDRIDATRGYTPDNIALISNRANMLKNNATTEELLKVVSWMNKVKK